MEALKTYWWFSLYVANPAECQWHNNIWSPAHFNPNGVQIDAPSGTPQVPQGVFPSPLHIVKISDVSKSCPLSLHKYIIVNKISQCLLQNILKAVNMAFESRPVKLIAKSCLEMVVLNQDKMKAFSSSPLESWKELQEIIRDGLKTVGVKAFVKFETGDKFSNSSASALSCSFALHWSASPSWLPSFSEVGQLLIARNKGVINHRST